MAIYVGGDTQTFTFDATGKVAGSTAENMIKLFKGSYESGTKPNQLTSVPDLSGNNNNGTVSGVTFTGYGTYTNPFAMTFDGVNDYVSVPNISISSSMSWEIFVKAPTTGNNMFLIDHRNSSGIGVQPLYTNNNGLLEFYDSTAGSSLTGTIFKFDGALHHVVSVATSSSRKIYYDGALVYTDNAKGITTQSGMPVYIGTRYSLSNWYNGGVLFVRIYNRALTDQEVSQNYQQRYNSSGYVTSGLVLDINARSCDSGTSTLPLPTDNTVWTEVAQAQYDKVKLQDETVTITNLDTTNRTASWNGKNLVLQSDTQPAVRDDFANKVSGSTTANPHISKSGVENYLSATINGKTLVNLLGVNGNFESDANSDGIADGWYRDYNSVQGVTVGLDTSNYLFGSKSQRISADGTSSVNNNYRVSKDVTLDNGKKYFISAYFKTNVANMANLQVDAQTMKSTSTVNAWVRLSTIITGDGNSHVIRLFGNTSNANTAVITYIDGAMLYDLTAIYGAGNEPSDITQLERELPFVDGARSSVSRKSVSATNAITNGNFANGTTGWIGNYSTLSVSSNTLIATGTGGNVQVIAQTPNFSPIPSIGKKYYFKCNAMVTNSVAQQLVFEVMVSGANQNIRNISSPIQNQWYTLSGVVTVPSDVGTLFVPRIWSQYIDVSTANGKVMQVQNVIAIDLTTIYGAGKEPSQAYCDAVFSSYFDGTSTVVEPTVVKSVGKNLFNYTKPRDIINNSPTTTLITNGFELSSTNFAYNGYILSLRPGVTYSISANISIVTGTKPRISVYTTDLKTYLGTTTAGTVGNISFNFVAPSDGRISVLFYPTNTSETADVKFTNIMIEMGSSSTTYEAYSESTQSLPSAILDLKQIGSVADNFDVYGGVYTKKISDWTDLGGDKSWAYSSVPMTTPSKLFNIPSFLSNYVSQSTKTIKYNGIELSITTNNSIIDHTETHATNGTLYINAPNNDTGLSEAYTPTNAEVKSYFYGWKMVNADGTSPYLPSLVPYTPSTWAEWTSKTNAVANGDGTITMTQSSTTVTAISYPGTSTLKVNTKYGMLFNSVTNNWVTYPVQIQGNGVLSTSTDLSILSPGQVGNVKVAFTTASSITGLFIIKRGSNGDNGLTLTLKDIRVFELPSGSQIESDFNTLTADQLVAKYTFNGLCTKNWVKVTDGSGLTTTLPTASYSGYTPYKMIYQLATPTTTTYTVSKMTTYPNGSVWIDNSVDDTGFTRITPIVYGTNPLMLLNSINLSEIGDYTNIITNSDSKTYSVTANTLSAVPQQIFSFNLIEEIERKYGTIPASDTTSKVQWLKDNIVSLSAKWYGYGVCPSGNKAKLTFWDSNYRWDGWWDVNSIQTASSPTLINRYYSAPDVANRVVSQDGFVSYLAYTEPATTTSDKILVLSNHGLNTNDFIVNKSQGNIRRQISSCTTNVIVPNLSTTNQQSGDVIYKYPIYGSVVSTETGTTTTTIKITNHGLSTGDIIVNNTKGTTSVTVVDANTLTCDVAITNQTVGDRISRFHYSGQQIAESTIIPSTIYTDYISLDVQLKAPQGYDILVDSNPRRDSGMADVVLVKKAYSKLTKDFNGKIAGSTVENPNIAKVGSPSSLQNPNSTNIVEFSDSYATNKYSQIASSNSILSSASTSVNGNIPQQVFSFDLIKNFENTYGTIPATDKVAWLKSNIKTLTANWYGYGVNPSGNSSHARIWSGLDWIGSGYNNTTISSSLLSVSATPNSNIMADGFVHFLAYTDPASSTTDKILVLSSHGLSNYDFVENETRGIILTVNKGTNDTLYNNSVSVTGQTVGDKINKFKFSSNKTATTGTNDTTLVITNHGLASGSTHYISNVTRNYTGRKVTVVDANTLSLSSAISGQASGDNIGLYPYLGTQYAEGTTTTQLTMANHGLSAWDFVENTTRNYLTVASNISGNVLILYNAISNQQAGDTIVKYKYSSTKTAETGTNSTTIIITNHGLTVGSNVCIKNITRSGGYTKCLVSDANTLTFVTVGGTPNTISSQTAGDSIGIYTNSGTQATEAGVAPSTIYSDYISLDIDFVNDNNALTMMDNNSVQINAQTINKTTAYMVQVDLNPIANGAYGGSNASLKSGMKQLLTNVYASGGGSNNGVLTNGIKVYWYGNGWYYYALWNNINSSISNVSSSISNGTQNAYITTDNKIFILITSQYPSDASVPSVVNLDYANIKIDFNRTPDIIPAIQINL